MSSRNMLTQYRTLRARAGLIHRETVGFSLAFVRSFRPSDGRRDSFMRRLTKPQRDCRLLPLLLLMYSRGYSRADCPLLNHDLFHGWTEFTNLEQPHFPLNFL